MGGLGFVPCLASAHARRLPHRVSAWGRRRAAVADEDLVCADRLEFSPEPKFFPLSHFCIFWATNCFIYISLLEMFIHVWGVSFKMGIVGEVVCLAT